MRYKQIPNTFFTKNRKKLVKKLPSNSLIILAGNELMPLSADQNYYFRQYSDFFYLTGIDEENALLCICPHHVDKSLQEVLFIQQSSPKKRIWDGYRLSIAEATEVSGIKTVKWINEFDSTMQEMALQSANIFLGLNEFLKFKTETIDTNRRLVKKIKELFPLHNFARLTPIISEMRLCKQKEEIEMIRKATNITKDAFLRVLSVIKPGMMEYEIEAEIIYEFTKQGSSGHAFMPIVAGGKNACVLHYITNDQKLNNNELLLIDFGVNYGNYNSDCSRTIPINGKFTHRQKECYKAVLDVLKDGMKLLVPGATIENTNKKLALMLQEKMIELGLFSAKDVGKNREEKPLYQKYYMHGASHFLGLDTHDVGLRQTVLKKGMVLTCEPGIYIEDEGIGIRLENTVLVDDVPINLMSEIPIEINEIESLIQNKKKVKH